MLSNSAQYALKAVLYIAAVRPARPVRAVEISDALEFPRNYLSKILNGLSSSGILESSRGRTGGFSLARDSSDIVLRDIVSGFDKSAMCAPTCLLGRGECNEGRQCSAHGQWSRVRQEVNSFFETTTIAQLLGTESQSQ